MSDVVDVEALRKVAEAATQGPRRWETVANDGCVTEHSLTGTGDVLCRYWHDKPPSGDGEFLAIFDAPTVLALLARLEAAEKKVENQRRTLVEFQCAISARNAQIWAMKQRALDPDKMTPYMNATADYPLRDPAALAPEPQR